MPVDNDKFETLWYVMTDGSVTLDNDEAKGGICVGVVEAKDEEIALQRAKARGMING